MFKNYKYCFFNGKVILKSEQRFKSDIIKCTQKKLIRLR